MTSKSFFKKRIKNKNNHHARNNSSNIQNVSCIFNENNKTNEFNSPNNETLN